jgi:hypothetical protein
MTRPPRRPEPATLNEFFALEQAAWNALSATWRGLPHAALEAPGACGPGWSVKDVMNHLAAWMLATRAVLPDLLAQRPLPKGRYHPKVFNAHHYTADRARSLAASRRRLYRARRAFLHYVSTLPASTVLNARARPGRWVKFALHGHYAEHMRELSAFARRHS